MNESDFADNEGPPFKAWDLGSDWHRGRLVAEFDNAAAQPDTERVTVRVYEAFLPVKKSNLTYYVGVITGGPEETTVGSPVIGLDVAILNVLSHYDPQ